MQNAVRYSLLFIGMLCIIAALALRFAIVPSMKVLPDDVDEQRVFKLDYFVLLDAETLEFFRTAPGENPNLSIDRHVTVEAVDGNSALVREDQNVLNGDESLFAITYHYALNRKTMEGTEEFPEDWGERDGFWNRAGLVIGWPIGTEKEQYPGWAEDYRDTVVLEFEGEEAHGGIDTYLFTSESTPVPIVPEQVEVLKLPTAITFIQLARIAGDVQAEGVELTGAARFRLLGLIQQAVAATQADDSVIPLVYLYDYWGKYWVEPTTGVLIDTQKYEHRVVTFPQEIFDAVQQLIEDSNFDPSEDAYLPADILEKVLPITANEFIYQGAPESVAEARQDAEDAIAQLRLFETIIPLALLVVGVVLFGAGWILGKRKDAKYFSDSA